MQFVSINGECSDIKNVTVGVPQGSALGPLFYLIYSNDIVKNIFEVLPYLYADDTTLLVTGSSITELEILMNAALQKIYQWSNSNELVLNPSKTKVMLFTTKTNHPNLNIYLNGNLIEKVSQYKYLGLWFQDNLKFTKHITELTSTLSKSNGLIYSLKTILPLKTLKNLYYSFTYPHLLLHILAWGGSLPSLIKPLKISQNNIIRNLSHNIEGVRTTKLYKDLDILTIEQLYKLKLAEFMYSASKGINRLRVDFMEINSWHHEHATRRVSEYRTPLCRLNINQCFFLSHAYKIWNNVPTDVRQIESLKKFRNIVKDALLENNDILTY
jgi:hypothetical protein